MGLDNNEEGVAIDFSLSFRLPISLHLTLSQCLASGHLPLAIPEL